MKKNKKYIFDIVLLALIFLVTYRLIFRDQDISEIISDLLGASGKWIFAGAVLAIVYVCCEGFVIRYMLYMLKQRAGVFSCLKYAFIGFFFSDITPSASGGQPAQIYYMGRDGINPGFSALIMLYITIAYKSILMVIGAVLFVFKYDFVKTCTSEIYGWMILGVFLNSAFIALLVLMLGKPEFMRKTGFNIVGFLSGKGFIKSPKSEAIREKINAACDNYSAGAAYIKGNPKSIAIVFLITAAERIFLLAVTYAVYRSFGLSGFSFSDVIALQSMIGVAVEMLPLPGAAGITESCFLCVFKNVFTDDLVRPALLASRGLSFYLILLIGAAVTLTAHINILRREKANERVTVEAKQRRVWIFKEERESDKKKERTEKMKKKLLGYYDYTVILTYCGMLFAFCGILQAIKGTFWDAAICLMLAGICDMFDGAVASTKNRDRNEKRFGIQIDSLSDLISFGVLPAIFVYMISGKSALAGIISALFVLSALIRLAYFNVLEEERQSITTESRKSYLGIPVTNIAILLPACYLLFDRGVFRNVVCFPALLVLLGAGFLMPIEIRKPGVVGKIAIIVVGVFEAAFMIFRMGLGMM